jgi:cysteine desulfuration protein SufE
MTGKMEKKMTIQQIQDQIIVEFADFGNWDDKFNHLVKLGKSLPAIDPCYMTDENLIKGCQVKTWFNSSFNEGVIIYNIDSRSALVKGIISLLVRVVSGQTPEAVKNADLYFIDAVGLRENFLPIRANSLFKILTRIKNDALFYSGTK